MRLGMMRELHVGQKFAGVVISCVISPLLKRSNSKLTLGTVGRKPKSFYLHLTANYLNNMGQRS